MAANIYNVVEYVLMQITFVVKFTLSDMQKEKT